MKHSPDILQHALIGLRFRRTQVDEKIAELEKDLAGGKKTEGRKRIAAAQQARWRKHRQAKAQAAASKPKARYAGG
jgi:hypothetical protein